MGQQDASVKDSTTTVMEADDQVLVRAGVTSLPAQFAGFVSRDFMLVALALGLAD